MQPSSRRIYKQVGNAELALHIFEPGANGSKPRPAIVFFFGGGWVGGTPTQFFPHCTYLASRGMVAISAEYRVKNTHGVTPYECVKDGKSAVRWIRAHASGLNIDPQRIAAGGGSAGGHVAACTGVIDGLDEVAEDSAVSSRPDALVLFNPVLVLASEFARLPKGLQERLQGQDPRAISPYHHILAGNPPTLILHGEADGTVPVDTARRFTEAMSEAGNRCKLVSYEGEAHGFFNFGRGTGERFYETLAEADSFLTSLGYLEGESTLDDFRATVSQTD